MKQVYFLQLYCSLALLLFLEDTVVKLENVYIVSSGDCFRKCHVSFRKFLEYYHLYLQKDKVALR